MTTEMKDGRFMDRDGPQRFRVEIDGNVHYTNSLLDISSLAAAYGSNFDNCEILVETAGNVEFRESKRRRHLEADELLQKALKELELLPSSESYRGMLVMMSDADLEREIATGSGKYKAEWIGAMQCELEIRRLTGEL